MADYRIGIDIGGTFTDFALVEGERRALAIGKQLTTPDDPSRAVLEGMRALLAHEGISLGDVGEVVHGTTLVTNAIIEGRGAVTGMLTTDGFLDVLDMRQEKRYDVFDLRITFPAPVVPRGLRREVRERIAFDGAVDRPVDLDHALVAVDDLVEKHRIEALAVCLLHAYANPVHEQALAGAIEARFPQLHVSTSSEVCPARREFERFTTTCINAFTAPMFHHYLARLERGLQSQGFGGRLYVMSSSGGTLTPRTARAFPVRVVESGPAAGVQMSVFHGRTLSLPDLLSFDMGGTTAKGALVRAGTPLKVYTLEVARQHEFKAGSGSPLKTPVIDMIEIGAGGGSIAEVDARGTIRVGPRSAGADPGPACYRRGGLTPTLTDANLLLGYLDPAFFLGGEMSLDVDAARCAVEEHIARPLGLPLERAALGIHEIISEEVARAFRVHASERGFDYRRSSMVAFGGSGPLHALGVARKLRIPRVVFPVAAGVMSALGLLASPLSFEVARTREQLLAEISPQAFAAHLSSMAEEAMAPLLEAGVPRARITLVRRLDMRYQGQGHEIEVTLPPAHDDIALVDELAEHFRRRYRQLYAFSALEAPLSVVNWKVEAHGPAAPLAAGYTLNAPQATGDSGHGARKGTRHACFGTCDGFVEAAVWDRYALRTGDRIVGPSLVEERESTVLVGPGEQVSVDEHLNLVAELSAHGSGVQPS